MAFGRLVLKVGIGWHILHGWMDILVGIHIYQPTNPPIQFVQITKAWSGDGEQHRLHLTMNLYTYYKTQYNILCS